MISDADLKWLIEAAELIQEEYPYTSAEMLRILRQERNRREECPPSA